MDKINLNHLLEREVCAEQIKQVLREFEQNKTNLLFKKGIYLYGDPGAGKTSFISNILREMDYDIIKYDAGDIRNKAIIDTITKHNMSDKNIVSMFKSKIKRIAIIMDEIDGMNNGDKGGINTLIKLIRPKKTKKQKLEEVTINPIICIGNYHVDKKIKELIKVCHTFELKTPTSTQVSSIVSQIIPNMSSDIKDRLTTYVQGDLRKLSNMYNIYSKDNTLFQTETVRSIFQLKSYNDDTKKITQKLVQNKYSFQDHYTLMNETDRTIVGLLWHENIVDLLDSDTSKSIPFYLKQLDNMCFADYIDRVTFQKQIWQFNEMSSLIKTSMNNNLFHKEYSSKEKKPDIKEVRFTKVLTKYSTEYNNSLFIQGLCQELGMDMKDLICYFLELKQTHDEAEILAMFENYNITKLDINRIYRYLEKYTKEDAKGEAEKEIDGEDELDLGQNEEISVCEDM
jgi:DNA polymerase III delta prime subunit